MCKYVLLFLSLLLCAPLSWAIDLAGTWRAEMATPDGNKFELTLILKVDGTQFTGVSAASWGAMDVRNGRIDGTHVTFDVGSSFDESGMVMKFVGDFKGDDLVVALADKKSGPPFPDMVFKKVSAATEYTPPPELTPRHKPFPPLEPLAWNELAATPPMGWNSWNKFAAKVDDRSVREMADAMVSSGMRDAGYIYLNIDDTWQGTRDAEGNLQPNSKFPDMKALADYVHSKGLKFGIYSGPGTKTCAGFEGSYMHEAQDAKMFASWGVDYLKYDWCNASAIYKPAELKPAYRLMGLELRRTGRPIVYGLCQYGWQNVSTWGASVGGNLWRTTGDISDNWKSMSTIGFDQQTGREQYAGPGRWNDPDMLEIGNGGMTDTEYRTHMSLWSMLAAPLLAGNDLRTMTAATREILMNREVIAVDQDKLGKQGFRVRKDGDLEVWKKPLSQGVAVALFNRGEAAAKMTVQWSELGLPENPSVRDLWAHKDLKSPKSFSAEVPSHGVVMLRVK